MTDVREARLLAEQYLVAPLPRRWSHVRAVGAQAEAVARQLCLEDGVLAAAAWLHDIGHGPELADTGFHPLDGARFLRKRGVDDRIVPVDLKPPVLTNLPIGAWVMSALPDAAGGPAAEGAADLLVTAGVSTAAAGLNDWSDTAGRETRVGLVHAALSLYLASLIARARGRRRGGHRRGSSQKPRSARPERTPTEEAVPLQNELGG